MSEKKIKRKVIKIGLLGDSKVGKTAICNSFLNIDFHEIALSTIGSEKLESKIKIKNGEEIKLSIYDTAGQERFHSIALKAIRVVQGVIIVFDLTNTESFQHVINWLNEIYENFNKKVSIVLFGNKSDINKSEWKITEEEAIQFAKEKNLPYFETSAKLNKNIKEGFEKVVNDAYDLCEGSCGVSLEDVKKGDKKRCCGGKNKNGNPND